jgi:hypothetical protein
MNSFSISKLFTFVIITLPILSVYRSPFEFFDLGTFLILVFTPFIIYKTDCRISQNKLMILLLFYIILGSMISLITYPVSIIPLLRLGKFTLLIIIVLLIGYNKLFNPQYAIKVLKIVTNLAVVYILVQVSLLNVFGILLPNGFPSLAESDLYLSSLNISATRPSSFFLEPAHFAQYSLVYLSYCMFVVDKTANLFNDWKSVVFISIGIILSKSGQGLLFLVVIWIVWLLTIFLKEMSIKKWMSLFCMTVVFSVIIPLLIKSELIAATLIRLLTENTSGGGNAIKARLNGFEYLSQLTGLNKIFGMGFGNVPEGIYLSGYAYIIYCTGYLGLFIFISILIYTLVKIGRFQKILLLMYSIMLIGAQMFSATTICFYFALFYINLNKNTGKIMPGHNIASAQNKLIKTNI